MRKVCHRHSARRHLAHDNASAGWSLGSEPEIQVATNVSNHLMSGVMKYFGDSGRYEPLSQPMAQAGLTPKLYRYGPAVNLFEKLLIRDGEIASLLAGAYIGMGKVYCANASYPD